MRTSGRSVIWHSRSPPMSCEQLSSDMVCAPSRMIALSRFSTFQLVPADEPLLDGNEAKYLVKCIETGWISSEGPYGQREIRC